MYPINESFVVPMILIGKYFALVDEFLYIMRRINREQLFTFS